VFGQFHRVVQYAANHDQAVLSPIDQEVARTLDLPGRRAGTFPTQPQMPRPNPFAEFRTFDAAQAIRLRRNVAHRGDDESFVALARRFTVLFVRPGQNFCEISLRRRRQSVAQPQPLDCACCRAAR